MLHSNTSLLLRRDYMKCQNCGGEISESSKFCPLCGHKNTPITNENVSKRQIEKVNNEVTEKKKKKRKIPIVVAVVLFVAVVVVALFPILKNTILPQWKEGEYEKVSAYIENEDYASADKILKKMISLEKITGEDKNIDYYYAKISLKKGKHKKAIEEFESLGSFKDSADLYCEAKYQYSNALIEEEKYEEAVNQLETLGDYKDSANILINTKNKMKYDEAVEKVSKGEYQSAIRMFKNLVEYSDSKEQLAKCYYLLGEEQLENKEWDNAISSFTSAGDYKDSKEKIMEVENARIQYWKNGVKVDFRLTNEFTTTKGDFVVHSVTVKLSDNEKNYIFIIDCTLPKNMNISFFNPPRGTSFKLIEKGGREGRNTYTFTISKKKVEDVKSIAMKFNFVDNDCGWISVETNQLY